MISVIVYGRNDQYGYNLAKRAALSINCIAELLLEDNDEIIFVDYNTSDLFPTFPQSIEDTLTQQALRRLRILRVRPEFHRRFLGKTHLPIIEPVARNIAVRRSNPSNRWVLSTNTDMIFVPRQKGSLTEIAAQLAHGAYALPRFEIPEGIWETFDRDDAPGTIEAVRNWGDIAHLKEIVFGPPTVLYDGPGDFQLIARTDILAINGFDERMVLGWHVDYNIAKRLTILNGTIASLVEQLFAYHCSHTRVATPMHSIERTENSLDRFVTNVETPHLPEQVDHWGWPDEPIEEIRLPTHWKHSYAATLGKVLGPTSDAPGESFNYSGSYNNFWYEPRHALPYILDCLTSFPRNARIAWLGVRPDTFTLFRAAIADLGFRELPLVPNDLAGAVSAGVRSDVEVVPMRDVLERADVFFVEFGLLRDAANSARTTDQSISFSKDERECLGVLRNAFIASVSKERRRMKHGHAPRLFVAINAINNEFEALVQAHIAVSLAPFSSRTRFGFVREEPPSRFRGLPSRVAKRIARMFGQQTTALSK